jgi:uncharacterized protein (DUF2164 family)
MNVTRFGVFVQITNKRKQYALMTSAAPILSSQKRYSLKMDHRRVLGAIYPATLPKYSKRYGEERLPEIARRKVPVAEVSIMNTEQFERPLSSLQASVEAVSSADHFVEMSANLQTVDAMQRSSKDVLAEISSQQLFNKTEEITTIHPLKISSFDRIIAPIAADIDSIDQIVRQRQKTHTEAVLLAANEAERNVTKESDVVQNPHELKRTIRDVQGTIEHYHEFSLLHKFLKAVILDGMTEGIVTARDVYEHIVEVFNRLTVIAETSLPDISLSQMSHTTAETSLLDISLSQINHTTKEAFEISYEKGNREQLHEAINEESYDANYSSAVHDVHLTSEEKMDHLSDEIYAIENNLCETDISQSDHIAALQLFNEGTSGQQVIDADIHVGHESDRITKRIDTVLSLMDELAATAVMLTIELIAAELESSQPNKTNDVHMVESEISAPTNREINASVISGIDKFQVLRKVFAALLDNSMDESSLRGRPVYEHVLELFDRIQNVSHNSHLLTDEWVERMVHTLQIMLEREENSEIQRETHETIVETADELHLSNNIEVIDKGIYQQAERNEINLSVSIPEQMENVERSEVKQAAICSEFESAAKQWIVIEVDLQQNELANIKEVMQQISFAGYETFERMMEHAVTLDTLESAGVNTEQDIVLAHFTFAEHSVTENVLMAPFTDAIRDITENAYMDEPEDGYLKQKKKKRIWLIPAKPNFYSGWTWKKTR